MSAISILFSYRINDILIDKNEKVVDYDRIPLKIDFHFSGIVAIKK